MEHPYDLEGSSCVNHRKNLWREDIARRAYLKWEAAGRPSGDGYEFWIAAENEWEEEETVRLLKAASNLKNKFQLGKDTKLHPQTPLPKVEKKWYRKVWERLLQKKSDTSQLRD